VGSFTNRSQIKDPYKRSMRKYRKAREQVWNAVDLALQRLAV